MISLLYGRFYAVTRPDLRKRYSWICGRKLCGYVRFLLRSQISFLFYSTQQYKALLSYCCFFPRTFPTKKYAARLKQVRLGSGFLALFPSFPFYGFPLHWRLQTGEKGENGSQFLTVRLRSLSLPLSADMGLMGPLHEL